MVTNNLKNVIDDYFPGFFRISRANAINLEYLDSLEKEQVFLRVTDTTAAELKSLKITSDARAKLLQKLPRAGSR